ncbi:putative disease resistance protein RGA1 [Malus sylvestris]|uniref:putative disease resistance protein RGA1 n=1 Tax=Malus sylvestris TaxID=3752 RepID=UPI0021ACD1D2|nr:putative disease resistance protein RGA1 [Malus sylvestris]XP_050154138.1 putative disease resistance protein RGA1 [Malus sylvestris]XP_050154139.1 putative disease resistance protein RGA1 [Malus sylvestris]
MARIFSFTAEGMLAKAASLAAEPLVRSWGLEAKLTGLHETLSLIQDITRDAADDADAVWVEQLKDVANDADDVLEDINYEVLRHKLQIQNLLKRKVLNFISLSNPVAFRLKIAHQLKKINASLVDLKNRAPIMELVSAPSQAMRSIRETNSSIGDEIIVGRDDAASNILATLTSSEANQENLSVMAIVGMPGLGKTTLAKLVFNKDEISTHFEEKIWIYVSNTFDVDSILNRILEYVECGTVDTQSQEAVLKSVRERLTEKRCLLVLDDVWNEDSEKWSKLMSCLSKLHFARGSTILVTTCNSQVATISGTLPRYDLGFLSEDECWSILKGRAFVDDTTPTYPDLEKVGREIAKKCAGLPSVAKVFGGMLCSKNDASEWSAILDSKIWDSPEAEQMIISGLKLSLDNLKFPILKQCFTYCSMFKEGFEMERDDLIQLWMAQGLLHPSSENSDLEMEDIGTEYFHILLQNSLLQDLTKDAFGVVAKCKMHILVHDFAELVSKSDSATSNSNEMVGTLKIRHASHIPTSVLELIPKKSLRGLRSLFSNSEVPSNMLPRFRGLHVLNLYNADIKELPKSIEKMKQLRYLNVSRTKIKAIPKSVGKLHNLQTLRMEYCRLLKVFPKEIGDLINLRHIYFGPVQKKKRANFGWYRESHVGVGQLTNLRKMPYFIVSPYGIGRGIEELAGLNHLNDELAIYDLEHVRDGEEAKKSNLVEKRNIRKLSLVWGEEMRPRSNSEEDVLQGLQPHPNLEILDIYNFMGAKFPSWKPHNNLEKIQLIQCDVCEEAPMLGHLPSLMHLEFNTMCNLKRLGDEFYGYDDVDDAMKTKALYPALKTFRISAAPNLIEWIEPPVVKEKQISVFPRLEELDLVECPQMRNFPDHFASLRKLDMSICHELSNPTSLVEKCISLKNLEISNCDKLRSLSLFGLTSIQKLLFSSRGGKLTSTSLHSGPELYGRVSPKELSIKCPSLENLEISCCNSLMSISVHGATSLRGLKISSCGGLRLMDLQSLPECYTPLQVLSLRSCKSLEPISGLHEYTSFRELTIEDCDGLKTHASIGLESCTSIRALGVHDLQQLRQYAGDGLDISLIEELTIYKSPKLISISDHGLTTLRKLVLIASYVLELSIVSSTTVEELYLQDCTSLGSLCIDNCERLRHVSVDGLETLIILKELTIRNCPSLTFNPITPWLRGLVIEGCEKLSSLPSELKHCNALERLKISGSRNLVSIPISDVLPPSLGQFVIEDCAQLSSLPGRHQSLEELSIVNCPVLSWSSVAAEGRFLTALRRLVIASCGGPELNIGSITALEEISVHDCTSLGELRIENCQNLRQISLHDCTSLDKLGIENCQNLISLADVDVTSLQSLSRLIISDCEKLQYLPTGLRTLTRLNYLWIGGFWEELDSFPVSQIPSSKYLAIVGWPKLKSLPQVINHSTNPVTEFEIVEFDGLETLPEWLGDLTSLYQLNIYECKNLKSLPSAQAMQRLTKLEYLEIDRCPFLNEKCARGTGTEWPKISHIRRIIIDSDEEED